MASSSGDVQGRYSKNAATTSGKAGAPKGGAPWSGARPSDASHTRTAGKVATPAGGRPDNIFGGKSHEPGSQRKDHK